MLKTSLEKQLFDAMRDKDEVRKRVIRLALASIKMAEIDKHDLLSDEEIINILQKEINIRKETFASSQHMDRSDMRNLAEIEIKILEDFLPQQLSDIEIRNIAIVTIKETDSNSISDMGKVMKVLITQLHGQASNQRISNIVRELLAKNDLV